MNGPYFYLAAGDCTGHGVPGAMLSMLGISFLNEIVSSEANPLPGKILDTLRSKIIKEMNQTGRMGENKDGMDISLIRLNQKTLELCWAGANNPLFVLKAQSSAIEEYAPLKQPVGFHSRMEAFKTLHLTLEKGDQFYLMTDGLMDQFGGPKGKKFKKVHLKNTLVANSGASCDKQKQLLLNAYENWKGDLEQVDDICVIGLRV
jgi:serine phosphatase RsbU (regulator of sigma subunit)